MGAQQQNQRGLTGNWGDDSLDEDEQLGGQDGRGRGGPRNNDNARRNREGESARPTRAFRADRQDPRGGMQKSRPQFPDKSRFAGPLDAEYRRYDSARGYGRDSYAEGRGDYDAFGLDSGRNNGGGYSRESGSSYNRGRGQEGGHWADRGAPIRIDHSDPYARGDVARERFPSAHSQNHESVPGVDVETRARTTNEKGKDSGISLSSSAYSAEHSGGGDEELGSDAAILSTRAGDNLLVQRQRLFNPVTGEMEEVAADRSSSGGSGNGNGGRNGNRRGGKSRGSRGSNGRNAGNNASRSGAPFTQVGRTLLFFYTR